MPPIVPILKGLVSYIPGFYGLLSRGTDPPLSARYCYSVWMRHLTQAWNNRLPCRPQRVAELGPGCSIGVGLAALISGASEYIALDIVRYAKPENNLDVFDGLITLFKNREDIPGSDEFPELKPYLDSYKFPEEVLTRTHLSKMLHDSRLKAIREALSGESTEKPGALSIRYVVPWNAENAMPDSSIDMLYSQAVLEHIDDLEGFYRAGQRWLKDGGFMSHQIDFKSHGTSECWDGHWGYSDTLWNLIRGRRSWLINRHPYSVHQRLMNSNGFEIVCEKRVIAESSVGRTGLSARFSGFLDDDLTTSGVFIQALARKPR